MEELDIEDGNIIEKKIGDRICSLGDIALNPFMIG